MPYPVIKENQTGNLYRITRVAPETGVTLNPINRDLTNQTFTPEEVVSNFVPASMSDIWKSKELQAYKDYLIKTVPELTPFSDFIIAALNIVDEPEYAEERIHTDFKNIDGIKAIYMDDLINWLIDDWKAIEVVEELTPSDDTPESDGSNIDSK